MSDVIASVEAVEDVRPVDLPADVLDGQLIGQLVNQARAGGLLQVAQGPGPTGRATHPPRRAMRWKRG
jgi:hypothetical protein